MVNTETEFVITGLSGRFPKAPNVDEFWNNLLRRKDGITDPDDRLPFHSGKLQELDKFDAEYFGISKAEVDSMDIR
ncbi:unnamed protein product, partial [Allacma fusca]